MLWVLVGLLAAAPYNRPFDEEQQLLERRLETLRRILPDGPTPDSDMALVRQIAEGAHLSAIEVRARERVDAGDHGEVILDVSALGRFVDLDRFFREVALSHRLADLERLALASTLHDTVKMEAVLRLPYRLEALPLPAPPVEARAKTRGLPRDTAQAFVNGQALALAKSITIAKLRRAQRNPRLFLSEVAAIVRERPVTLAFASLDDGFVIRGLTVGEGPVRALESRFERGFFRVSEFLVARDGACRRFEVRGSCPVVGLEAELPLPVEDPFRQDEAPCRVDRDSGKPVEVRGPRRKPNEGGPLSLRLRDVDLPDIFQVLHEVTGRSFLVDGNVRGRGNIELDRVEFEEAISELRELDLDISARGSVWRVSRKGLREGPPNQAAATSESPKASFSLKRAPVREILAVMTDADPTLAALGPKGSLGRVSIWSKGVPVTLLREAVLSSAGLAEQLEDDQRILRRGFAFDTEVHPVAGTPRDRRLVTQPQDLAILEIELAGLASAGSGWMAFVYAPRGVLHTFRAGDHLADGTLRAVHSTGLVIDTASGPIRVSLPDPAK